MKPVRLSDIPIDEPAIADFFGPDNELLLSRGEMVHRVDIEVLQRKNFQQLMVDDSVDVPSYAAPEPAPPVSAPSVQGSELRRPKILDQPRFKEIRSGKRGLTQLLSDRHGSDLDTLLRAGKVVDQPQPTSLASFCRDRDPSQRTLERKNEILHAYDTLLWKSRQALESLVEGQTIDSSELRTVIDGIIELLCEDRVLLWPLATQHPSGQITSQEYLYHHCFNTAIMAVLIGTAAGYNRTQVSEIGMGALLHDVGMFLTPIDIRYKRERLREEEWDEIHKNPILALLLLDGVTNLPQSVLFCVYQSHECENGTGYPKARSSRFIHRFAKIVHVADMFEALSAPRPFRESHMPYQAIELIIKMTKQGLVAGDLIKNLLSYTSLFPIGSIVELSDHHLARVIKAHPAHFAKPLITVIADQRGQILKPEKYFQIDLAINTKVQVIKTYKSDYLPDMHLFEGF